MNILDIIILLCLVPAIVQGLRKGFISQAISIISIIAGMWASAKFADVVADWVSQYITAPEQAIRLTAFAIVLIGAFLLLALIGKALEGILKLVMLGWVNRILGVVFSVAKCVLILGLLVTVFNSLNVTLGLVKPEVLADSILYPYIQEVADFIFPYLKSLLAAK